MKGINLERGAKTSIMGRIEPFLLKSARTDSNSDIVKEIIKDSIKNSGHGNHIQTLESRAEIEFEVCFQRSSLLTLITFKTN